MAEAPAPLLDREFDAASLVSLRRDVERYGQEHGLTGLPLYRFVVAVNEITTNAVRHGGGHGRLRLWRKGDRLYCEITDSGPGLPPGPRPAGAPEVTSATGRGLLLARHGANRMTITSGSGGTSVLLEVASP